MGVTFGIHLNGKGFLRDDGVVVAVDSGINAHGEEMLVVLGKGAGGDDVAVGRGFTFVDVDDGDDSGGASLNCDAVCY